jgi:hypothetical protein
MFILKDAFILHKRIIKMIEKNIFWLHSKNCYSLATMRLFDYQFDSLTRVGQEVISANFFCKLGIAVSPTFKLSQSLSLLYDWDIFQEIFEFPFMDETERKHQFIQFLYDFVSKKQIIWFEYCRVLSHCMTYLFKLEVHQ